MVYITKPLSSTQVLFIPKGSTSSIVAYLNKSTYELNIIDKIVISFLGYPQHGWIDLKSNYMTKADFLYKITKSKAALKNITLIPGETSYFFLKDLALKMNLSYEKLKNIYDKYSYKKDGSILADTYSIPYGMKEEHLLFYLFSNTNKKYEKFSQKIFGTYDKKKWYYYISLASIIQKEAANEEEMPLVSSVIHNRLKKGMPLQMDGTLNYGKYSHIKITKQRIRNDNSQYNTYKNKGIPSDPVCAVSFSAIKAAIFPIKSDYLYFMKDKITGKHRFTKYYKSHLNNINDYKKQKKIKVFKKNTTKTIKTTKKIKSIKSLWNSVNP